MSLLSYSRNNIEQELNQAREDHNFSSGSVRLLFSPVEIDESNFHQSMAAYSTISKHDFDTVVIIESASNSIEKKLPMPSNKYFETPFGTVKANDRLRNDFADEDDDFFVSDVAFDYDAGFYDHLMMLQCILDDFSVLSMQITEESSFIVKELAFALEEILASKNALIICCANLHATHKDELTRVLELVKQEELTGLMNYLNSGESNVEGLGAFITGLIVSEKWKLELNFPELESHQPSGNLLTGVATMQNQTVIG